jgi:competence protein ComEC
MDLMIWIVTMLPGKIADLPYSYISMKTPSPSVFVALICAIFGIYYLFRKEKLKRNIMFFLSSAFTVSVFISAISDMGEVNFSFVNVGQGDGAVIHRAFGETVIIDGGGGNEYSEYNPGESVFVPYLSSKGYGKVDCAFVSHLHKDHIQGVIAAIGMLDVENLFLSPPEKDKEPEMEKWREEIETTAKENGTNLHYLNGGERIRFKSGLIIDVYPQNEVIDFSSDGNDSSLLMKVTYGDTEVLYTGDMTGYCEKQYLKSGINPQADILKVAHHGSNTSATKEWLEKVNPEYAVISCGENNCYGHPSKSVLNRLKGCGVLRTDVNGDITFVADKKGIKSIRTLR